MVFWCNIMLALTALYGLLVRESQYYVLILNILKDSC